MEGGRKEGRGNLKVEGRQGNGGGGHLRRKPRSARKVITAEKGVSNNPSSNRPSGEF